MKHAFLITAYTGFDFLMKAVDCYTKNNNVDCYIHVDKKYKIPESVREWANGKKNVYLFTKYKVNWGSYKHIEAVLFLMKQAVKTDNYDYFHILSANSFITKGINEVLSFFDNSEKKNFVQVVDLDEDDVDHVIDPWFIYYHFLHIYDKRTELGNNIDYYFEKIQRKLGIKRKRRYRYKGLLYAHYTKDFVEYALKYVKDNPAYMRNLKTCNISEEFFFQNIIMNSPFKDTVIKKHLFYDVWNSGGVAQFLNENDYEKISNGEYLFARKFGHGSEKLFEMICQKQQGD